MTSQRHQQTPTENTQFNWARKNEHKIHTHTTNRENKKITQKKTSNKCEKFHIYFVYFSTVRLACAFFSQAQNRRILCPMICEKVKKQFCKLLVLTILCILLHCRRIVVADLFFFPISPILLHIVFCAQCSILIQTFLSFSFVCWRLFCLYRSKVKCMLQKQTEKMPAAVEPPTNNNQIECLRINSTDCKWQNTWNKKKPA